MTWKVFILVFLFPSFVLAQTPPIETTPPGDDRIAPLGLGEKAPFEGQLFDTPTALRWANWLKQYKYRLKADVELSEKICVVKGEYSEKVLAAEKERASTVETDLKTRLLRSEQSRVKAEYELQNPPWYKSFWFPMTVGVVGTVAVGGVTAWLVSSVTAVK